MKKKATDYDLARLPKWAQDAIDLLARQLAERDKELAEVHGGRPDAVIQVRPGGTEPPYGLPEYGSVRCALGSRRDEHGPRQWVDVRMRDGKVELMGSSSLLLFSQSSNVVYVDLEDRYELNEDSPVRDLGERLMKELEAKGLGWQDGLNLIAKADPAKTKAMRLFKNTEPA